MARRAVRLALSYGVLAGLVYAVAVPVMRPAQVGIATDVYALAVDTWLAGGDPYAVSPPAHPGFRFLYPPVVLLAFLPHALAGGQLGAYLVQTALNLATAAALAWLSLRSLDAWGADLARVDRWLVAAFALASVHSVAVYVLGQVNLQLALGVAVGAWWVERDRGPAGGAAFALAAVPKLFPAVTGLWLLARRAWRGLAAAILTGLLALAAGWPLVGTGPYRTFLVETLASERRSAVFAGGLPPEVTYVSVRRPIGTLLPWLSGASVDVLGLAVLAPVVGYALLERSTREARLVGLLATLLAPLVYLPLEPFYFSLVVFPLVPLLYLLEPGRPRALLAAGTVGLSTVLTYPTLARLVRQVLPGALAGPTTEGLRATLAVAQPPLIGAALVFAGCVVHQRRIRRERGAAGPEAGGAAGPGPPGR